MPAVTQGIELSRLPLIFALPEGSDAPSGGNVYNRELTRALAAVSKLEVTGVAGAARRFAGGGSGLYFFDTLDLEQVVALPRPGADQRIALIVHHLPSLEPDLPPSHSSRLSETRALARVELFLATSDWTRDWLVSRGQPERAIVTVPPAVSRWPTRERSYAGPLQALLVANLVPRKDVLSLLVALRELGAATRPFVLRIVGRRDLDPAYARRCEDELASSPRLRDRVHFGGPIAYERMAEVYDSSHLLVSSARFETFGMALREARTRGLPILARDGGYARHHFESGENGLLFDDARALAAELVELASDERRMGAFFVRAQRGRLLDGYDWAAAAERFRRELERASLTAPSRSPVESR